MSSHTRRLNPTCSLEFVPIPTSRIARALIGLKRAPDQSTDVRRIVNGSASTTRSAATVLVEPPLVTPRA